jgi:putative oxidoreductase
VIAAGGAPGSEAKSMHDRYLAPYAPQLLSVLRIMSALLLLEFGTSKFLGFPYDEELTGVPLTSLFGIAGVFELVGGTLLAVGLFTRVVAFVLSGEMAFAYFIYHAPMSFFPLVNQGVPAALFCFVFLYIAAAGPGAWSIDGMLSRATPRS